MTYDRMVNKLQDYLGNGNLLATISDKGMEKFLCGCNSRFIRFVNTRCRDLFQGTIKTDNTD